MFEIRWNATALVIAGTVAFAYDFFISWLLHLRYSRQFGWSFVASGLVSFSLPCVSLIGVPLYLILDAGFDVVIKGVLLLFQAVLLLVVGYLLKRKILSKIFPAKKPPSDSAVTSPPASADS
ncbi:MAG: hypothetical protein IGS03_09130 [Candidatus Sericytochromatia bacterium]|nr:hypothetical protein [Candidatus Sericytochromatia bacterium]